MNSLLLFNLLLGTLMVVPDLSKGQLVFLNMPLYSAIGKEIKMICSYSNTNLKTVELAASKTVKLLYNETNPLIPNITLDVVETMPGLSFEMQEGSTKNKGAVIFYIKNLKCKDFKSYTCMVNKKRSPSKVLKLGPGVNSITSSPMELIVNKTVTFTCKGTSFKGGPYEMMWYRNNDKLTSTKQPQIKSDLKCSNAIEGQLVYTVEESDMPELVMWCTIKSGFTAVLKVTFKATVAQPGTTPNPKPDCKMDPKPDCKPEPHFPNSAASNKTKTLLMAFNSILFLLLFSSLN